MKQLKKLADSKQIIHTRPVRHPFQLNDTWTGLKAQPLSPFTAIHSAVYLIAFHAVITLRAPTRDI